MKTVFFEFFPQRSHIYGEILRILKSEWNKETVRRHETLTASFWENLKTKRSYEKIGNWFVLIDLEYWKCNHSPESPTLSASFKCSRVLGAPFQSVEFALNFLAFGSVAHGLIAFETVLQGEHQAGLFIRFLCVHFLFVFVGCVKMTILVSLQRCVRMVKSRTPRMRAQEVKYMINSDSHAADWLLWHTARLHIFFCLVFSYSLLVIVKQR